VRVYVCGREGKGVRETGACVVCAPYGRLPLCAHASWQRLPPSQACANVLYFSLTCILFSRLAARCADKDICFLFLFLWCSEGTRRSTDTEQADLVRVPNTSVLSESPPPSRPALPFGGAAVSFVAVLWRGTPRLRGEKAEGKETTRCSV
jgi:hypothetical protein